MQAAEIKLGATSLDARVSGASHSGGGRCLSAKFPSVLLNCNARLRGASQSNER